MNDHPHELLAEYVDGSLGADDRATVEAHLASCSVCTDEVAVAEQARMTLSELPEVPVPLGLDQRILRQTKRRGRWDSPFAWKAAGVVAAAAAVVGVGTAIFLGTTRGDGDAVVRSADRQLESAEDAGAGAPAPAQGAAVQVAAYPRYSESGTNYTAKILTTSIRGFADEARAALVQDFPPTAREFYRGTFDFSIVEEDAALTQAIECVNTGVPPDRTVVPFVVEAARFEGKPAYLVAYLRGPDPESPYDRVQVIVVDRESCGVLHFARQNL
jgi:anti-sigma factor RsiW